MTNLFAKSMLALAALGGAPAFSQQYSAPDLTQLVLELRLDKTNIFPGELIDLRFRLSPRSASALAPATMSVRDGSLRLFISSGREGYAEYNGPGWGVKKKYGLNSVLLESGHAVEASATLLYNEVPPTSHLSPLYAARELAGKVPRAYALSEPGAYLLKAMYRSPLSGDTIESAPVPVFIQAPAGRDLEVWNILEANPGLGCLIQEGMLPGAPSAADEDHAITMLEEALSRHPSDGYTRHIEPSLEAFRKAVQQQRNGLRP